MYKVKKEFIDKVSVSTGTETTVLAADTPQDKLEQLAADKIAGQFIEFIKPEKIKEDVKVTETK
jgi:hypothetical protein